MARYLVTGGCGFIGSHLVDSLLAAGHSVRVLDDLSTGKQANIPGQDVELLVGDVSDAQAVMRAMTGMDGCFHLAAVASVQRSSEEWLAVHRVNVTGTIAVLEAARVQGTAGPLPVVYASSAAIYGDNQNVPLAETECPAPQTAYGADKLGSELHAKAGGLVHAIPSCGLRFFNVYGPRQDPKSPYSGVISIFAERITGGKNLVVHGDGKQSRDFVFVSDVVAHLRAGMTCADTSAPVFNVCTGISTSIIGLAHEIAALAGTQPIIEFGLPRAGDIRDSLGDPNQAAAGLGVRSAVRLRDGLGALLSYY